MRCSDSRIIRRRFNNEGPDPQYLNVRDAKTLKRKRALSIFQWRITYVTALKWVATCVNGAVDGQPTANITTANGRNETRTFCFGQLMCSLRPARSYELPGHKQANSCWLFQGSV
jgi:hypothetical protein